jgi:hypothetical protein
VHNRIRAVVAAAAIAAASASGAAGAQVPGWNLVKPVNCFQSSSFGNGEFHPTLWVYTQTYTFTVNDPAMVAGLLPYCWNAWAFWGYNAGSSSWSMFWFAPGQK